MINTKHRSSKKSLFKLIKSLNKVEKRAFKLSAQSSTTSNNKVFVQLFNKLESQKVLDEVKILTEETRISKKQLPNLKKYLYESILETITTLHRNKDIELKVNFTLDNLKILYQKNLFQQCSVLLKKATDIAQKYELFNQQITLLEWESKLQINELDQVQKTTDVKEQIAFLKDRKSKVEDIFQLKKCLTDLEYLRNEIFVLVREKRFREVAFFTEIEDQLEKHPVLIKNKTIIPLSFRTQFLYYQLLGIYYITIGENKRSLNYFNTEIELIEDNLHILGIERHYYAVSLYNYILNCTRIYRFDNLFYDRMEKLKTEVTKGNIPEVNVCCMEVSSYTVQGKFTIGKEITNQIALRAADDKIEGTFILKMDLYFDLMYLNFGAADYNQSLFWLNKIINSDAHNNLPDLYIASRFIQIVIHFELNNQLLIGSLIDRLEKYLVTRKNYGLYEKKLIRLFRQVERHGYLKKPIQEFLLKAANINTDIKKLLGYFDFEIWAESKITNKYFDELLKSKFKKQL